jgi:hypothetical protein
LDEEKPKHAGLAQQNGFVPAFLHRMLRLPKGTAKLNTCYGLAISSLTVWDSRPVRNATAGPHTALKGHIFYFLLLTQCAFCGSLPVYKTVGTPSSIVMEPDQDPLMSYHSLGSREVPRKTHCMRSLEAECPHDMLPQYAPSRLYW